MRQGVRARGGELGPCGWIRCLVKAELVTAEKDSWQPSDVSSRDQALANQHHLDIERLRPGPPESRELPTAEVPLAGKASRRANEVVSWENRRSTQAWALP